MAIEDNPNMPNQPGLLTAQTNNDALFEAAIQNTNPIDTSNLDVSNAASNEIGLGSLLPGAIAQSGTTEISTPQQLNTPSNVSPSLPNISDITGSDPSSIELMTATDIINNEINSTGGLSPETAQALEANTGLSMTDINQIALQSLSGYVEPSTAVTIPNVSSLGTPSTAAGLPAINTSSGTQPETYTFEGEVLDADTSTGAVLDPNVDNIIDINADPNIVVGSNPTGLVDPNVVVDPTTVVDPNVVVDPTTVVDPVTTTTTTNTVVPAITTVDIPEDEIVSSDPEGPVVEVVDDPVDPSVPEVTVNEDGSISYKCPDGFTLSRTSEGEPYCRMDVTNVRMRPGQGVNRYRSTPVQGSNPQRTMVNTSTRTTGATEVAS